MISVYSSPDPTFLAQSRGTVLSCQYFGDGSLIVIDVKCIKLVVAMIPHEPLDLQRDDDSDRDKFENRFFMVERPGLDMDWQYWEVFPRSFRI
jgi:hypothetical protein